MGNIGRLCRPRRMEAGHVTSIASLDRNGTWDTVGLWAEPEGECGGVCGTSKLDAPDSLFIEVLDRVTAQLKVHRKP